MRIPIDKAFAIYTKIFEDIIDFKNEDCKISGLINNNSSNKVYKLLSIEEMKDDKSSFIVLIMI
jgi:hypothetical protein